MKARVNGRWELRRIAVTLRMAAGTTPYPEWCRDMADRLDAQAERPAEKEDAK